MQYGLIGEKLSHSDSKFIHGLIGDYAYALVELAPEALPAFLKQRDFLGVNVTIPYKQAVMFHCDFVSDEAKRIGSVNTIVKDEKGRLMGYNTDYFGFQYMAEQAGIAFSGQKVLILGAGGTALTAMAVARDGGAKEVLMASRRGALDYASIYGQHDCNIIINATPVGMYPDNGRRLIDIGRFQNCRGVIDVIYNPHETALLQDAQALSIPCTGGLAMLVAQAARAAELFLGEKMPPYSMETVYKRAQAALLNVVLIGMPGSGKSAIGRVLAESMGREFIDTDALIEEQSGMNIPDIFVRYGEDAFRDIESLAIAEAGKRRSVVIATGGGAVLRKENRRGAFPKRRFILYRAGYWRIARRGASAFSKQGGPGIDVCRAPAHI